MNPSGYRHLSTHCLGCLLVLLALVDSEPRGLAGTLPDDDAWKFDVIHLKSGRVYQGLIVEDRPEEIKFRSVVRKPGSPTSVQPTTFRRDEIDRVEALTSQDREALRQRLQALAQSEKVASKELEGLKLTTVPWGKDGKDKALQYESRYFTLRSDASEDVVKRAALRLNQVYAAYVRILPAKLDPPARTTILLCKSTKEYRAMAAQRGCNVLNPAFFLPSTNEVLCGWEAEKLDELLEETRKVEKAKGVKLPREIEKKLLDSGFAALTRELFETLQHEAFHAYLANFVYNPRASRVPTWLNEGLAQVFEVALVEAGELRVGHLDQKRLQRLKDRYRDDKLVPVVELVQAGGDRFLAAHESDRYTSDRHYLTSLGLAHFIAYDRKLLGTNALDQYVKNLTNGMGPTEAFRKLVAQPLPEFEDQFLAYIRDLRPDGKVEK